MIEIFIWMFIITIVVNVFFRVFFNKVYFMHKPFIEAGREKGSLEGCDCGYKDGSTNAKMYYAVSGKIPDSDWLASHKGKRLDTREKILSKMPTNIV